MNLDSPENDQDGQKRQFENLIDRNGESTITTENATSSGDGRGGQGFVGAHQEQQEEQRNFDPVNSDLMNKNRSEAIPISQNSESQNEKSHDDSEHSTKPKVFANDESQFTTTTTAPLSSSPGLSSANAVKKFNSLSVAKQFLQKASPVLGNASAVPISSVKGSSGSSSSASLMGSSRLSSMMPASRLTSAKLTNSFKPPGAGWAQVTPAAAAAATAATTQTHDTNPPPAAATATVSGIGNSDISSGSKPTSSNTEQVAVSAAPPAVTPTPATSNQPITNTSNPPNTSTTAAPSPRLVTALSNRSTSPHIRSNDGNKGSPGLRNAAISGLGRTNSPSINNSTSSSVRAPWASVKKDSVPTSSTVTRGGIGKRTEFPTAAEAAQAKIDAEKKEKAAAAEAALKAEQALQNLEKFRGTTLGTHWDEMDDDDFGDGELRFGDGSSYKVQPPEKEVSKEERFRDVGHDRSWPPQSGAQAQQTAQQQQQHSKQTSTKSTKPEHTERIKPHKVETVAVRSGEGISLDAPSSIDRPHSFYGGGGGQQKERRSSFLGRQKESREEHNHHSAHVHTTIASSNSGSAAPVSSQIRAWGPLAQRQASLNPDAPKPVQAVNVPSTTNETPLGSSKKTTENISPEIKGSESASRTQSTVDQNRSKKPNSNQAPTTGRALPPHLALRQAQPAQESIHHQVDVGGTGERPDWRTAVPRPIHETKEEKPAESTQKEVISRSYGSIIASARQSQSRPTQKEGIQDSSRSKVSAAAAADPVEDRASALERARKRKEVEEEERKRERERALAKAAAIEAKMREAQEVEEKKKRLADEQRQKAIEEEDRRRKEKESVLEQSKIESKNRTGRTTADDTIRSNKTLPRGPRNRRTSQTEDEVPSGLQISTSTDRAVSSLLSPSDEAVSWRRGPKIALHSAAPGSSEDISKGSLEKVRQEIQPQKILLRRPETSGKEENQRIASNQSATDAFNDPRRKSDTSAVNATESEQRFLQKRQGRNSVRNDNNTGEMTSKKENEDIKRRSERSRVEIIAPTDEGAAKHAARQRERESRQIRDGSAKVPVGVLKSSTSKETPEINQQPVRRAYIPQEPEQTRTEVPFDGAPVWNKFQVRIGRRQNKPYIRLNKEELRGQQSRIAKAKDTSGQYIPKAVSILSWTPPILDLPARTLSRDDQFFPKRYRKGVRIANVILPSKTIAQLTEENLKMAQIKKLDDEKLVDAQTYTDAASMEENNALIKPIVRIPSNSNKQKTSDDFLNNSDAKIPIAPRQQRNREMNGAVAFARSNMNERNTPSPVSFTMQSELGNPTVAPTVLLGNKNLTSNQASTTSSSTWGENSLTFAGLHGRRNVEGSSKDISQSGSIDAEVERNRIKDAWGSLPSDVVNQSAKPTQNSLKDIGDLEIPSAISMSMHDLRADEVQSHQIDDQGPTINPAKSIETHLYTPVISTNNANDDPNRQKSTQKGFSEFSMMTAASSPINVASPTQSGHLFGGGIDTIDRRANLHHQIGRARSQSPSSMRYAASSISAGKSIGNPGGSPSMHLLNPSNNSNGTLTQNHRGPFLQQERGGARAAFGPYAYPSTTSTGNNYSSEMAHTHSQQAQQYSGYGIGQSPISQPSHMDGYETGYGSGYDNNSIAYNTNQNYRGGNNSGGIRSQNYDAFGNSLSMHDSGYSTFNDRNAYNADNNLLSGSGRRGGGGYIRNSTNSTAFGGSGGGNGGGTEMMGNMMGSEAASAAGWPIDSSSGSYMGNAYNAQHPNTYFTGYQSVNPTSVGSTGYGNLQQQQPSTTGQSMHSMSSPSTYNRSSSQQHNRFVGSSNYRGMGGGGNNASSLSSNGYGNSGGQWGNRNSRSHGINSTSSFGSNTNPQYQQQYHNQQHGDGTVFDSTNTFPRTVAGSTLQATAKPFQLNNGSSVDNSRSNNQQHQSYPRGATNTAAESRGNRNAYGMDRTSFSYDGVQEQTDLTSSAAAAAAAAAAAGAGGGGNYDSNTQW